MKKINITKIGVIILFIIVILNFWYSQNNLKFISKDMKEQVREWLNIEKEYSNSLELISANKVSAGLSSHNKYCELIFKISKEEYEDNNLNYTENFDSPEMILKGKEEYGNDYYMCIIRYKIIENNDEYYTLLYLISNANTCIKIVNIIMFLSIILTLIFINYLNTENNKVKYRRIMITISTIITIVAFSIIIYISYNRKDDLSEDCEKLLSCQSQLLTETIQ